MAGREGDAALSAGEGRGIIVRKGEGYGFKYVNLNSRQKHPLIFFKETKGKS